MLHAHIFSWVIGLLLFALSYVFTVRNQVKASLVTSMILRLIYLLIIFTGVWMVVKNFTGQLVIKGLLGLILIGTMEMILSRTKNGKSTTGMWGMFVIVLAGVLYYGYVVLG